VIVRLQGGLGNQMFQYAFGRSVSIARGISLYFDRTVVDRCKDHRQYMMDAYDVKIEAVLPTQWTTQYPEKGMPYDEGVFSADSYSLFLGYWQTEKYFKKHLIRQELINPKGQPTNRVRDLATWAAQTESTFIQIRRGDYANNPSTKEYHGLQPLEYYLEAADYVKNQKPNTNFLVFSDDPKWCEENFPDDLFPEFTIVKENSWQEKTAQWDLWIMSHCKNGIMANSSFGWWGAWLGDEQKDRVVVAPKKWFDKANVDERDIVPKRWVRI
jgi:hypothetical protein